MWEANDFLSFISNEDGSVKLFEKLSEADQYADKLSNPDDARVISIEGVHE